MTPESEKRYMLDTLNKIDAGVTRLVQRLDEHEQEVKAAQERYWRDMQENLENLRYKDAIYAEADALNATLSAEPVSKPVIFWFLVALVVCVYLGIAWSYFV